MALAWFISFCKCHYCIVALRRCNRSPGHLSVAHRDMWLSQSGTTLLEGRTHDMPGQCLPCSVCAVLVVLPAHLQPSEHVEVLTASHEVKKWVELRAVANLLLHSLQLCAHGELPHKCIARCGSQVAGQHGQCCCLTRTVHSPASKHSGKADVQLSS